MTTTHVAHVFGSPWLGVYSTDIDSGRHFDRHWHETYGFGLLERGGHSSASGRGRVHARSGDVITTNPGEVHDGRPLGGSTRRWRIVHVDQGVMKSMTPCGTLPAIARPVIQDKGLVHALARLFRRMERLHAKRHPGGVASLASEEALIESCTLLLSRHGTPALSTTEVRADVRAVHDRLADDLVNPPTLAEMAIMTGLSKYQVLRRFERVYGLPPHAWLLRRRAERARVLIRNGVCLAAAAAAAGFADQSHMTRMFARQYGFTPGAWRRAIAAQ